jgi:3-deoxy-D-manno-octulosonic-acid transferase
METERRLRLSSRLALAAYDFAANVLLPAALLLAAPLLCLSRKRRKTLFPRLGFQAYPVFKPGTPAPVWVHALSVGELLSAVPFLEALKSRLGARPLVVSVSTLAARELAEVRLRGVADALLYFPYDTALAYRRCLRRIRPAAFVLIETDLWPGYLRHFQQAGVPCWLLNGRLSPDSFRRYRRGWALFGPAFACFQRIHGQSEAENERFAALGVARRQLGEPGNLKFDACGAPPAKEAVAALRAELGYGPGDRILLAGSTHPGEEELVRTVFRHLRPAVPGLKLILVPRHPQRAGEVRALWAGDGLPLGLLSAPAGTAPDVLIVDRLGYLNRLYSLAEVAIVGGSFVPKGGQNPIEPAAAGKPVLFGPDMSDFPDVARELLEREAAFRVKDAAELEERCRALLSNLEVASAMGARGQALVDERRGATRRITDALIQRLGR